MRQVLFYLCCFLLISSVATSFGWYLACNKPCNPEIIEVKGDTVWIKPDPIAVITPDSTIPPKRTIWQRIKGSSANHKVKEGENLYRIGLAYNLTAEELRLANNLKNFNIKAGDTLRIPSRTIKDTVYTYEKSFGDSTVKGMVYTQSFGSILSQSVSWESIAIKPRNRLYGGLAMDKQNRIYGIGAYELKSGWLLTGSVGSNNYQLGVLKRLK